MPRQRSDKIDNVKPVTFERYMISNDGETIIFELHDKSGNVAHIAVDWLNLCLVVQLIGRAGEKASQVRSSLGKSDDFDGASGLSAQLVSRFQVSEYPEEKLKVLSLHSAGLRCEFAIPTDKVDQRGRLFHHAIAEELLSEESKTRQRPH